jgi:hypothetical protein
LPGSITESVLGPDAAEQPVEGGPLVEPNAPPNPPARTRKREEVL